jgi:TonB family protein
MTMEQFILFILRASLYLLVLSGGYFLLFRKENRPSFNRFFILCSFVFSLLLAAVPGFTLSQPAAAGAAPQAIMLPEMVFYAAEETSRISEALARGLVSLGYLPLLVGILSLLFVLTTMVNLFRIAWLISTRPVIRKDGMYVVLLNQQASTFSFFNYVFVPGAIPGHPHFPRVLAHEMAHWRCGHSWDILFMEAVRVLFWFHPFYYILRKELTAQHEFEADGIACRSVPKTDYQQTLLDYTLSGTLVPLTNPFNISLIKKRITMMNTRKNHSKSIIWIKLLALIPMLSLLVAVQACQDQTKEPTVEPAAEAIAEPAAEAASAYVEKVEGEIFNMVDDSPVFPGGEEGRVAFLQQNLRYPESARDAGDQGTVFVSFVIRDDGRIANVKVLRGVSTAIDEEAVRVVKMMPRWTPGKLDGEPVNVQFNMPIRFVLQKNADNATVVLDKAD